MKEYLGYGGDFTDRPTDYNFSGNGLIYADRTESPKAQEVKQLYSNIKMSTDKNGVLIKNENLFINVNNYDVYYNTECEGKILNEGYVQADVEPGEEKYFEIPFVENNSSNEYIYNVSVQLKEDTLFEKKGYELCFSQYVSEPNNLINESKDMDIKIIHGDVNIGIHGRNFKAIFSKQEGGLVSLRYSDKEYITRVPKTYYWRATTDNDRGNKHEFRCSQWLAASIGQKYIDFSMEESKNSVKLNYTYELPTIPSTKVFIIYTVCESGKIKVNVKYNGAAGLPELPVLGMNFRIKAEFDKFTYYGFGPEENYIDRANGAKLGVFNDTCDRNLSKYLVPQECGNRINTRYVKVYNDKNEGLQFTYDKTPFEFSILHYNYMELENALHREELPPAYYTNVNIIGKQIGVGGDDSWGAPVLKEYLIDSSKDIEYSFYISNINK